MPQEPSPIEGEKENVRVVVRSRPMDKSEISNKVKLHVFKKN